MVCVKIGKGAVELLKGYSEYVNPDNMCDKNPMHGTTHKVVSRWVHGDCLDCV